MWEAPVRVGLEIVTRRASGDHDRGGAAGLWRYQAEGWPSRKSPPFGPSSGSVATQTIEAAPSATGRAPVCSALGHGSGVRCAMLAPRRLEY